MSPSHIAGGGSDRPRPRVSGDEPFRFFNSTIIVDQAPRERG